MVYFGGGEFFKYELRAKEEKIEILTKTQTSWNQLAISNNANGTNRRNLLYGIRSKDMKFKAFEYSSDFDFLAILTSENFLFTYSPDDKTKLKFQKIELEGAIIRFWISQNNLTIYIATREGFLYEYSTSDLSLKFTTSVPLSTVLYVDTLVESYRTVFFNAPDEIVYLKSQNICYKEEKIEKLEIGLNCEAFKLESPMLAFSSVKNVIACFQENLHIVFFNKRNMKAVKEINMGELINKKIF